MSRSLKFIILLAIILLIIVIGSQYFPGVKKGNAVETQELSIVSDTLIENGIHVASGLVVSEGFEEVKAVCTHCHSAKLVTQNRATRAGWEAMIDWMQETQGLWELGDLEPLILDYLAANYAPQEVGRRANLEEIEWYNLEE